MGIILFSGVHGVGKGYFLKHRDISDQYTVVSASYLISKHKKPADAGYKKVKDISKNQDVLTDELLKLKKDVNNIILDGHICLRNKEGNMERISKNFFTESGIKGIILLQDDSKKISQRIFERDSKTIDEESIKKIQNEEIAYAKFLKKNLGIAYYIVSHLTTKMDLLEILNQMENV